MEKKLNEEVRECKICGKRGVFKTYYPRDMMYEVGDEIEYFYCDSCDCLQISEIPEDISIYYRTNYYSFLEDGINDEIGFLKLDAAKILDVGCGTGNKLINLRHKGYYNLVGCDPFINEDIEYKCGVVVKKCPIHEMAGQFDVINMSDSFEHMADPREVLESVNRLLNSDGYCTISIPLVPNIAFGIYKENWYQIDAPRHLFLHSINSINILAKQAGLLVSDIKFNATGFQFVISELYKRGLTFKECNESGWSKFYTQSEIDQFNEMAGKANQMQLGDHAVFTLMKIK